MIDSRVGNILGAVLRVGLGALGLTAVIYQLTVQIDDGASVANFLSFFTIESNILAALVLLATGLMPLSTRPGWWDRLRGAATWSRPGSSTTPCCSTSTSAIWRPG